MSNLALAATATLSNCDTEKLESIAQRFVKFLDVSELSVKSYSVGVRKFLSFLHCNCITQPTRETVILYKRELCEKYSANTTALYISALRRFFTWCESEGLYANIASGVKSPRISREHKRDAFSATELKEILSGMSRDTLQEKRDFAVFALIASCGLRTVEVSRLNVGDMHKVAGVWTLDVRGKGHASADAFVKLSEPVQEAIAEYLKARGHVSPNEPLFASCSRRNRGGRLTTRTISGVCKAAMLRAGYDSHRLTAHSLRHSAITLALMAGMSLDDVSAFARHSSISVTMIYNHSVSRLKSRCEAAVSAAIFGA